MNKIFFHANNKRKSKSKIHNIKAETCRPDEFDCEDSTCIDIGLKCDGVDNCKYRYDEDKQTTCAPGNFVFLF